MAGPIYKLYIGKWKEAYYQLSEDERSSLFAKIGEAREKAGGKVLLACESYWSSEEWMGFGVQEFPDIEALQEYEKALVELNLPRYGESKSWLGTK